MRIAYVCSDVDVPVLGSEGCSLHVRDLIAAFDDAGHEVMLLCNNLGEGDPAAIRADVRHIKVDQVHEERDRGSLAWNRKLQDKGEAIFEDWRPDFVYERYALFGWGGFALAWRHHLPHLLELNAPLCREQMGQRLFTLVRTAELLERAIVTSTDAVLAVSPWLREWAIDLGAKPDSTHVVPNGVDAALFAGKLDGRRARERHGLAPDDLVVGYVGSFHEWHDVSGLLSAFAELAAGEARLRLLLVGHGPRREAAALRALELGIEDAVVFTGHVEHREAAALIAAMDVAVVPYAEVEDFYCSPLELFECMAAGTPTVAAGIGQIEQVIEHGITGLLYPPGDDAELAALVRLVLTDRARARAMGGNGRREVLASYTWDAGAQSVVEIAERLAMPVV
jgi:glycosyltransferase involved in cell wall biosynthesis